MKLYSPRSWRGRWAAGGVLLAAAWTAAATHAATDIRRLAPPDANTAVYGKFNPEREPQRQAAMEAWKTIQDERIGERLLEIVTSRMPADKLSQARSTVDEFKRALGSVNCEALTNASEGVFAQRFEKMSNVQLFGVRLSESDAAAYEQAVTRLFGLLAKKSGGEVTVSTESVDGTTLTRLVLPEQVPFQPAVARVDDVLVVATHHNLLRSSLALLKSTDGPCKFDDARLKEALTRLPEPEDSVAFFDGATMWRQMRGIPEFIRAQSPDKPEVERVSQVFNRILDEVAVLDYTVAVDYMDGGQGRHVDYVQLADGYQDKLIGKVFAQGQPYEQWQSWVPADATAYSLSSGANLHELYVGVLKIVDELFPESREGVAKFEQRQAEIGFHLDRDLLQAFSGESISVTLPVAGADGKTASHTVSALRCTNPERIRELIARAVDFLAKSPALQGQQIALTPCDDLEGFQQVKAAFCQMIGAEPVVGFRDDWMIMGTSPAAVKRVLAVRRGEEASVDAAAGFAKFDLKPQGAVYGVSYADVGQGIRDAADGIDKAAAFAPMVVGMIGAKANPEDLKPVMELVGLLPSVAKVVRKFDYHGHRLTVVQGGPVPGSYLVEKVQQYRLPATP